MYNDNLFQSRVHPSRKFPPARMLKFQSQSMLGIKSHIFHYTGVNIVQLRNNASKHFTSGRYIMTAQRWTVQRRIQHSNVLQSFLWERSSVYIQYSVVPASVKLLMVNRTQDESKKAHSNLCKSLRKTYSVLFEIPKVAQHRFIQCQVQ